MSRGWPLLSVAQEKASLAGPALGSSWLTHRYKWLNLNINHNSVCQQHQAASAKKENNQFITNKCNSSSASPSSSSLTAFLHSLYQLDANQGPELHW